MNTLVEIFRKEKTPAVPPRVPFRELVQKKSQEVNQEGTQMKRAPQSRQITNAEPLRVPIVNAYPYEPKPVKQEKNDIFFSQSEARI